MPRILPALRAFLFVLSALSLGLVAGCGLKGDLALPEPDESTGESEADREPGSEDPDAGPRPA